MYYYDEYINIKINRLKLRIYQNKYFNNIFFTKETC